MKAEKFKKYEKFDCFIQMFCFMVHNIFCTVTNFISLIDSRERGFYVKRFDLAYNNTSVTHILF